MKALLVLTALLLLCTSSVAQTNPKNVPQPPSAELQKFEPFLGKYEVSGDYANLPWTGTLELRKVIKGWYIEQIIQIKSPGIDREFWVLTTWDKDAQKYRLWGFQTLPNRVEGEVRFENDEMITEFTYPAGGGQTATSTNRYKFIGREELIVTSYRRVSNGPMERIGTLKGKRLPNSVAQTADGGEKGGLLKPWPTMRANRVQAINNVASSAKHDMPTDSSEIELRALMAERRKASVEGDTAKIAASMTDDYIQTDINGYRQDKTTWLNEYFKPLADLIKAGKFHWQAYEQNKLQFRFYGDCAVVTGDLQAKGTGAKPGPHHMVADPNASFSATLQFTHVYVKRNGKWLLAALHNQLPLPANPAK